MKRHAVALLLQPAARQPLHEEHRMAPFTVDDGFRLAAAEDPQVSPDGNAALYVVNTPDLAGNGSVSM